MIDWNVGNEVGRGKSRLLLCKCFTGVIVGEDVGDLMLGEMCEVLPEQVLEDEVAVSGVFESKELCHG